MWLNEAIVQWHWDGVSIDSIVGFAANHKMELFDFIETYFCEGWPDSVPENYRGWVFGPVYGKRIGNPEGYKKMLHILAIDKDGKALTFQGACDVYLDADGYDVVVTTAQDAIALAKEYRAVAD
ncbi:hypothetical protein [Pseudomonas syringae group genomosp. 3]|uniref:Uncharacterized protein n=1 Tax=Pseudomonas syringae pv. coriandricola TaxID=264453 RepID=A0A3M3JT18_9PSED|nr:hypothetical protein [Pseudomonas syringae group genomosp. 3]RMN13969.1 hypothetical protein ALQ65_200078 [Pseudomonas syringae pv. coriandricola]